MGNSVFVAYPCRVYAPSFDLIAGRVSTTSGPSPLARAYRFKTSAGSSEIRTALSGSTELIPQLTPCRARNSFIVNRWIGGATAGTGRRGGTGLGGGSWGRSNRASPRLRRAASAFADMLIFANRCEVKPEPLKFRKHLGFVLIRVFPASRDRQKPFKGREVPTHHVMRDTH